MSCLTKSFRRKLGTQLTPGFLLLLAVVVLGCESSEPRTGARAPETTPDTLATDRWTYVEIDSAKAMWGEFAEPEWLRYFGLAAADLNGDGYRDVVTGRNAYLSPGGDLTGDWEKVDLGTNVDANLVIDLPGGEGPAILAESLPDVLLFRIRPDGSFAEGEVVAQVPPTGHHNGQGYRTLDLTGTGNEQVVYASQGGLYVLEPAEELPWRVTLAGKDASDEGFAAADMDGDGDLDLTAGYRVPGADAEVPTVLVWFENPGGAMVADWKMHRVGTTRFAIDRVEAGDVTGDGRADVVVAEERYPGLEPDASLWLFAQSDTGFVRRNLVTQYSMNNLDLADLDGDGDLDLTTAEHKGEALTLQLWLNDGTGNFTRKEIDRGKESHLGARAHDMDGDGDLDLISIGWDQHRFVHLWRNDAR